MRQIEQQALGSRHFPIDSPAMTWEDTGTFWSAPSRLSSKAERRKTSVRKYGPRPPSLIGFVDSLVLALTARSAVFFICAGIV
jgi:hypothetical protein